MFAHGPVGCHAEMSAPLIPVPGDLPEFCMGRTAVRPIRGALMDLRRGEIYSGPGLLCTSVVSYQAAN